MEYENFAIVYLIPIYDLNLPWLTQSRTRPKLNVTLVLRHHYDGTKLMWNEVKKNNKLLGIITSF